jgi:DNA-directed RNA polymerase subunit RPC12/RpoP
MATNCTICGKELKDKDEAYGTTEGYIDDLSEGFVPYVDRPWLTVACKNCGERISEAISNISSEDSSAKEVHIYVSGGVAHLRKAPPGVNVIIEDLDEDLD